MNANPPRSISSDDVLLVLAVARDYFRARTDSGRESVRIAGIYARLGAFAVLNHDFDAARYCLERAVEIQEFVHPEISSLAFPYRDALDIFSRWKEQELAAENSDEN